MSKYLNANIIHYTSNFSNPLINVWGAFSNSIKEVMMIVKIKDLIIREDEKINALMNKMFPKHMKKNQILILECSTENIYEFFDN